MAEIMFTWYKICGVQAEGVQYSRVQHGLGPKRNMEKLFKYL